ncbi:MAG TPA: 4a-hydroxytetrahydrobiopterin dehydratase [Phycisphaerales bacterium]|jgi:4a-hydroxytetrahydrobiopterin dehydratase|nr:4a-hydroxytetrahydrobiopterin dehydratase [Phycisphaerales bacterium]
MDKMTDDQVKEALQASPDWAETGGQIHRTYQFQDFVEAMKFVNSVAQQAEADQHHPDILIRWNKVTLTLSTHDAGGITSKDFALAARADAIARMFNPATVVKSPVKKARK